MGRISRDRRDIYYRKAKEVGFRARSAFKLLQLDDAFHFLSPPTSSCCCSVLTSSVNGCNHDTGVEEATGSSSFPPREEEWEFVEEFGGSSSQQAQCCTGVCRSEGDFCIESSVYEYPHRAVDLCAAPGSWSQVLRRRLWENYERKLQIYEQTLHSQGTSNTSKAASGESVISPVSLSRPAPPLIVAVDLQELAPLPGVCMLQGDITHVSTAQAILRLFNDMPADIVVCDGAPDVTGTRDVDEFIQMQLVMAALATAAQVLRPGGTFVCKVFRGEQIALMNVQLMALFADVRCCKPAASRSSSVEAFVVCRGFHPKAAVKRSLLYQETTLWSKAVSSSSAEATATCESGEEGKEQKISHVIAASATDSLVQRSEEGPTTQELLGHLAPFLSCGSVGALDSDRNYFLSKASHSAKPPTQPPTHPAYEEALRRKRGEKL